MIYQANDEIRLKGAESERRRLDEASIRRPFAYLDWLIVNLEEFHMAGKKRVPKRFEVHLNAAVEMLPPGVTPPILWRTLIRHVIDQVFDLQEQMLQLRDPDRLRTLQREEAPAMPPMFLLPQHERADSAVA
jgi:hypothetical protein